MRERDYNRERIEEQSEGECLMGEKASSIMRREGFTKEKLRKVELNLRERI